MSVDLREIVKTIKLGELKQALEDLAEATECWKVGGPYTPEQQTNFLESYPYILEQIEKIATVVDQAIPALQASTDLIENLNATRPQRLN